MGPFLWGAATSGYQSEGGFNQPGTPKNNWFHWEHTRRAQPSGMAVDFWNRYEGDLEAAAQAGLNAFRLGIEWARVQPSASPDRRRSAPSFDDDAVAQYARMIARCRQLSMEPIVTLHHFTHPAWLGADAWLRDETVEHFERFVDYTVSRVNQALVDEHRVAPVRVYVTINEPNILALNSYFARQFPAIRRGGAESIGNAMSRLLAAHVRGRAAILATHERHGWGRPEAGITLYMTDVYWSSQLLFDLLELSWAGVPEHYAQEYVFSRAREFDAALDAAKVPQVWGGRLRSDAHRRITSTLARRWFSTERYQPLFTASRSMHGERQLDFLAIDYYDPFSVHVLRWPGFDDLSSTWRNPGSLIWDVMSSKWWDWRPSPEGMVFFCARLAAAFPDHALLIGENGLAMRQPREGPRSKRRDGWSRSDFLRAHVAAVQRTRATGIPLIGYLHWSLFDNYEWGTFTPRFGLLSVDYATLERSHVAPDGDRPLETFAALLSAERIG